MPESHTVLWRYGIAVVAVTCALLPTLQLEPLRERSPFLLLIGAVAVISWVGGLGPGLLATLLATVANTVFVTPPPSTLGVAVLDTFIQPGAFVLVAVLINSLDAERLRVEAELRTTKEAAEAANRVKDAFLATMSHELRTPLHIIMGYTGLLLDDEEEPVTAEHAEMLRQVDRSARKLLDLIVTMLDVSRLEAGLQVIALREVDPQELLTELEAEVHELLRGKAALRFIRELDPDLPVLYTDAAKLQIVLKNLLDNAVKFTAQGSVTLTVHAREQGIEFAVRDTGIGMAPDVQAVMFEMFRQGDSSPTRRYAGVGLGLYIVKGLVAVLGGTISVESVVGQGSTFRVWVPSGKTMGSP